MLKRLSVVLLSIILLTSCMTHNISHNYDEFNTFRAEENKYYYFSNNEVNSLIIYIDGSGLSSVLGVAKDNKFESYSFAYPLSEYFSRTDSILIPEKPGMSFGGVHNSDPDVIKLYTVENLVDSYAKSIDHHLYQNHYENICIIGVSEGGLLVPKIYSQLENKYTISTLVIIGAGGLSQYDCFRIQYDNYPELPTEYRDQLAILEEVKEDIIKKPHSMKDGYLGWPYSRWSSFFEYVPLEYLYEITIPILYIQGKEDPNSPLESVKAVEKLSLSNISFEYIDNMGHLPDNNKQADDLFGLIKQLRSGN